MIIVSITGPTMQEAREQIKRSERYADMFELRLDMMERPNIARLIGMAGKPTIATCRPMREGGSFRGAEFERIEMLELASVYGANYVDIEFNSNLTTVEEFIRRRRETKVIVSFHLLDGALFRVAKLYKALAATGADVIKLAYPAEDAYENDYAFDFLSRATSDGRKAIAVAIGEAGEPSRVLYKKFGGWATYAAPETGSSASLGQIKASILKEVYRADRLNSRTLAFGVVGNPLGQSKGVYLHNPLFHRMRKNAVYCKFLVSDMEKFFQRIGVHLQGFSVTIPHKQSVMKYLDRVDKAAQAIGAVNTVVRRGANLVGTNTDAPAALDAIERKMKVGGRTVLVVGTGGAARAIVYEAKKRGAFVVIANRTVDKARTLAAELGVTYTSLAEIRKLECDILVNATPVGMTPHVNESPLPRQILNRKVIFDVVYNPVMTRLLREARSVTATTIPGTEMYVNQAARQSYLYTGRQPDMKLMRRILNA
jgi:3-dehydroquinate dehydratase/shikimate dehydrogenase